MRVERIRQVLEEKRQLHPELASGLNWEGLRQILARENVGLFSAPLPNPARLLQFEGAWNIVVSSLHHARRRTMHAAHELAHIWLHVDEQQGRFEPCINYSYPDNTDPREDEANYLMTALLAPPHLADRLAPAAMIRRPVAHPRPRAVEDRFPIEVSATTFWQPTLEGLVGGWPPGEEGLTCDAVLRPDDPLEDRFPFPIRVELYGRKVGYLSREDAMRFRQTYGRKWVSSMAAIVRDRERNEFGVRLDLELPR